MDKERVVKIELDAAELALLVAPIPNPGKATIARRIAGRIAVEVARAEGEILLEVLETAALMGHRVEATLPIGGPDDRSDEVRG